MTSKAKYSLINTWISNTIEVQRRKFYEIQQIFAIFCSEMAIANNINISKLTFQKNVNKIAERTTTLLERVHIKRNIYHYILLNKDDNINIISSLRINPTRLRREISTPTLSMQSPTNHSSNSETTLKPSDKIKTMTKSDLPVALSFFLAKTPLNKEDVKIELIDSLVKRMNCM